MAADQCRCRLLTRMGQMDAEFHCRLLHRGSRAIRGNSSMPLMLSWRQARRQQELLRGVVLNQPRKPRKAAALPTPATTPPEACARQAPAAPGSTRQCNNDRAAAFGVKHLEDAMACDP